MAFTDWSTTAGSNGTIGGINIAEGCPAGNLNGAQREMMAELRSIIGNFALTYLNAADAPTTRAALGISASTTANTALGAVTPAADKLPYFTGASAANVTDLTAFARTLLASADASAVRALLGVVTVANASIGNPGFVRLDLGSFGTLMLQWGLLSTTGGEGAYAVTFPTPFPTQCFVAVATIKGIGSTGNDMWAQVNSVSATGLSIEYQSGGSGNTGYGAYWIAVGN